jgi:hypothetical protein
LRSAHAEYGFKKTGLAASSLRNGTQIEDLSGVAIATPDA